MANDLKKKDKKQSEGNEQHSSSQLKEFSESLLRIHCPMLYNLPRTDYKEKIRLMKDLTLKYPLIRHGGHRLSEIITRFDKC